MKQIVTRRVRRALDGRESRASPTRWSRCSGSGSPGARARSRSTSVTEDVVAPGPVVHAMAGAGSGYLTSTNTISYANARAGRRHVTATIPDRRRAAVLRRAGHRGGPAVGGRSSRSCGSTPPRSRSAPRSSRPSSRRWCIPHWTWAPRRRATWVDFDVELRSGYAWRPTLAAADWRPGAGHRGQLPAARHARTPRGAIKDSFGTFEDDAGSGLAGAIVKGGETQLFLVSSRTVAGTAPASTGVRGPVPRPAPAGDVHPALGVRLVQLRPVSAVSVVSAPGRAASRRAMYAWSGLARCARHAGPQLVVGLGRGGFGSGFCWVVLPIG